MLNRNRLRLFANSIFGLLTQVSNVLVFLIATPVLVGALGAEAFGTVAAAISFCFLWFVLTDFGLNFSLVKEASLNRNNLSTLSALAFNYIAIKAAAVVASLPVFLIIGCGNNVGGDVWFWFGFWVYFASLALLPNWLFQGVEKISIIAGMNFVVKSVYLLCVLFTPVKSSVLGLAILNAVCGITVLVLTLVWVRRLGVTYLRPNLLVSGDLLRRSSSYFISRVGVAIYAKGGTFIVSMVLGGVAAANYAIAEQVYRLGQAAIGAVSQALYPYMALRKEVNFAFTLILLLTCLSLVAAIPVLYFLDDVIIFYVGSEYLPAASIARVFVVALLFVLPSSLMGFPIFAALGYVRFANYSLILGALTYGVLLGAWYMLGAVTALLFAVFVMAADATVLLLRVIGVSYLLRDGYLGVRKVK